MSKNRVLIVDDDQSICRLIARMSDQQGVDSVIVNHAEFVESTYLDYQPTLIVMDMKMPMLDGVELLRMLEKQSCKAAIILISGIDKSVLQTTAHLGESMGLNIAGVLTKPMDIERMKILLAQQYEPITPGNTQTIKVTEDELAQAIRHNELVVCYQPQVYLETGELIAAEALVRWQHPEHGLLFPDTFITMAENRPELIKALTYKVLETVLKEDVERRARGVNLHFSVNLSAVLLNDLLLPDKIEALLARYQFGTERLLLEITENKVIQNPALTMDILLRLRLKNIRLSIDDFGTGFSSLVQLYHMPFNELKIDKSFIMKVMSDEEAASISRITTDLGHSLGLKVVAEGIDDQPCFDWLKKIGCDIGQGDFISTPLKGADFLAWVEKHHFPTS
ncbi:MAG: EAL domain-containing response regulator [Methylococcales bacterium]|jgi:EAL domain-containing protein (putative c-di-GMP-specific phosphodiesterase class I)